MSKLYLVMLGMVSCKVATNASLPSKDEASRCLTTLWPTLLGQALLCELPGAGDPSSRSLWSAVFQAVVVAVLAARKRHVERRYF